MNGIGGHSIAEAKETLSLPEFKIWAKYRNKYGSLNAGLRTEWASGVISSVFANTHRDSKTAPFKPTDFTEHFTTTNDEEESPISLEDAMNTWH